MLSLHATVMVAGFSIAAAGVCAMPQSQGTGTAATAHHVDSSYKPTNLKVLPKTTSGDDLDKLMHQYQQYLGQPCAFCHEENGETKLIDYAIDENPVKNMARLMISMTADINSKYLAEFGDRRYAEPFTCGNCHRGQIRPPAFEADGMKP